METILLLVKLPSHHHNHHHHCVTKQHMDLSFTIELHVPCINNMSVVTNLSALRELSVI